ncbi:heme/hemin ABC transporter substrate-binding protein [Streptomyces armeniacus]|uniref:heme/hemin ABC transporter substrate-binding protein n=1 Tax=Streptomyces armeniacus TaxID=83291 RepID=UPI001FE6A93F|nr:ABC transporter substrate-binding protein [Streptomyces armeniacus]
MRQPPRVLGVLAALLSSALVLTACGGTGGADAGGEPARAKASARADRAEPLTGPAPNPRLPVTVGTAKPGGSGGSKGGGSGGSSDDGGSVTVESAERIVPLSGSLSEIVFSLGLGDRVVARDVSATFEQAAKLPLVTRGHDVSAEGVLALKPTVVLAETTTGPDEAVRQLRDAGVPVVVVAAARELDDVGTRIDMVAAALGVTKAGDRLRTRTEQRIAKARQDIPGGNGGNGGNDHSGDSGGDGQGTDGKPRVAFLYLRGTASVYLLGGAGSGASSLIEAAGGVDAGKESGLRKDFTALTSEALVKAAPDVILVMAKGLESVGGVDGLVQVPGVAQTPAGMDRRVASVDDGVLLSYGPRTDRVLRALVRQFHEGAG